MVVSDWGACLQRQLLEGAAVDAVRLLRRQQQRLRLGRCHPFPGLLGLKAGKLHLNRVSRSLLNALIPVSLLGRDPLDKSPSSCGYAAKRVSGMTCMTWMCFPICWTICLLEGMGPAGRGTYVEPSPEEVKLLLPGGQVWDRLNAPLGPQQGVLVLLQAGPLREAVPPHLQGIIQSRE